MDSESKQAGTEYQGNYPDTVCINQFDWSKTELTCNRGHLDQTDTDSGSGSWATAPSPESNTISTSFVSAESQFRTTGTRVADESKGSHESPQFGNDSDRSETPVSAKAEKLGLDLQDSSCVSSIHGVSTDQKDNTALARETKPESCISNEIVERGQCKRVTIETPELTREGHIEKLAEPQRNDDILEQGLTADRRDGQTLATEETEDSYSANKGCTLQPKKKRKTRLNYKFLKYLQLSMLGILTVDVILISLQVTENGNKDALQYSGIVIALVFMIDLSLRLYAYGLRMLKSFLEVLDAIIVIASFIITILFYFYDVQSNMQYFKFLIIGRPVRYARLLKLCNYRKTFQEMSRKIVSQNRRRWEDEEYNLDLTYITDQILVMSYPSEGCTTVFRNSCKEVARFLNEKHTGQYYTVYNLCSENTYDTSCFDGPVIWCPIDDHNVPGLRNMIQYALLIQGFLNKHENNVAVIHCKGGKGRTGTIVSAMLINSGLHNAEESLQYFASKRTNTHIYCCGQRDQGVRVKSQIRYVNYFERVKREYKGILPPRKELLLHSINITNISAISGSMGGDITIRIQQMHPKKSFEYERHQPSPCAQVELNLEKKDIVLLIPGNPVLCDDIKVMFFRSSIFPCCKKSCILYFWFHTAFIDGFKAIFHKKDLDTRSRRPFRKKTKDFQIQLNFSNRF